MVLDQCGGSAEDRLVQGVLDLQVVVSVGWFLIQFDRE